MKHIIPIILGLIFLIFAAICPLPSIAAVSGILLRVVIGLLGCCLLAFGAYKTACKR